MEVMKVKKLKEFLDIYPEEAPIKIHDGCAYNDIESIAVEYTISDDYSMPVIVLKTQG